MRHRKWILLPLLSLMLSLPCTALSFDNKRQELAKQCDKLADNIEHLGRLQSEINCRQLLTGAALQMAYVANVLFNEENTDVRESLTQSYHNLIMAESTHCRYQESIHLNRIGIKRVFQQLFNQ